MGVSGNKSLILLAVFLLSLIAAPLRAEMEDFEFYKKYGHHSKAWDDYVSQGFGAYDQQNCDQALSSLKQAVAAQCQDALVYYKLAVCSEVQGTPYTALQYYQLAEEKLSKLEVLHRYQKDIYESYGRALFQAKRYDEAFPYLTKAATIGTPSFGLYYMVGFLYAKKNDPKAALEFFEKSLAQDTSKAPPAILAMIYREVAKTYVQNKDYTKANDLLGKALALNPNDQDAIQLRNQISNAMSQQNMLQMIQNAEGTVAGNTGTAPVSKPPPPAASKLPPLDAGTPKDPTPPLGTVQGPAGTAAPPAPALNPAPAGTGTPPSSGSTVPSSPGTLQPLPPPPPK